MAQVGQVNTERQELATQMVEECTAAAVAAVLVVDWSVAVTANVEERGRSDVPLVQAAGPGRRVGAVAALVALVVDGGPCSRCTVSGRSSLLQVGWEEEESLLS